MRHQTRITIVSLAAGFGLAGILQVAALVAAQAGFGGLARFVDWPTTLLKPLLHDAPLAYFAGFPLGGAVYSLVANLIFRKTLSAGD